MKKIIQLSSKDTRFFLEDCQFFSPLNVYFIGIPEKHLLMRFSKTRFFVENVLYYCLMAKKKLKKVANHSLAQSLEKRREQKLLKPKIFSFDSLVNKLHQIIETFPDCRIGKNISKDLKDAALGGFAVFFTQSPSFLAYQKSMQKNKGRNNAASLFGIKEILSDNHIRNLLDAVAPSYVFPMFSYIFDELNHWDYLDEFRSYNNNLLVALDGTGYFSSQEIHCHDCSQKHHKNKDGSVTITYSHSAVTPVIVKPGSNKVISLIPEYITPQDGHDKQDCENAAAKRWLRANGANGAKLNQLGVTITGDDLYCKQPLCKLILDEGLDFILTCKEESHKTLYEYVEFLKEDIDIETVGVRIWTGRRFLLNTYRFLNGVPLPRKTFFQDIRALTRYMYFGSWDEMMLFMIHGLELEVPVPKARGSP